jgi:hypothetical protein
MRVRFDKQTSAISFDMLGYQDVRLQELQDRIREHFDANAKTVPGRRSATRSARRCSRSAGRTSGARLAGSTSCRRRG